jgi:hypothetical protein
MKFVFTNESMRLFSHRIAFGIVLFVFWGVIASGSVRERSAQIVLVEETINQFMQESLELRLKYEYRGSFFEAKEREMMLSLSLKGSERLGRLYEVLKKKQAGIEAYEGDDWDELYGVTGEWRDTVRAGEMSVFFKSEIDFFTAIALEGVERGKLLGEIVRRCQSGEGLFGSLDGKVLYAKTIAEQDVSKAKVVIDSVIAGSDLSERAYFEAQILRLKLDEEVRLSEIKKIVEELGSSKFREDFELNVKPAFLALNAGSSELLLEVIRRWPETETFLGRLFLEEITEGREKDKRGDVFKVNLAVKAALAEGVDKYKDIILRLCEEQEYRNSLVLYCAGEACVDSEPIKAIEYYLQSVKGRNEGIEVEFRVDRASAARKAAELACRLYRENTQYTDVCEATLKEYLQITGERADGALEYFYVGILEKCGKEEEAVKLLNEIAEGGGSYWQRASLDLILNKLREGVEDAKEKNEIKKQLEKLAGSESQVKVEAVRFYCELELESEDEESADRALSMLARVGSRGGMEEAILKGRALRILGRCDEGALVMAAWVDPNDCRMAEEAILILSKVLEEVEDHSFQLGNRDIFLNECKATADYCIGCLEGQMKDAAGLIWAEFALLGKSDDETLRRIECLLAGQEKADNAAVLRCRARLLSKQGNFGESARIWGQICSLKEGSEKTGKRSRHWWQAKYNQLYCLSKHKATEFEEIRRSIEIMENSFEEIPVFWAKKLKALEEEMDK